MSGFSIDADADAIDLLDGMECRLHQARASLMSAVERIDRTPCADGLIADEAKSALVSIIDTGRLVEALARSLKPATGAGELPTFPHSNLIS